MVVRLGSAILVLALYFWNPYPFQLLELKTFDWLMMSQESIQNENILIVDLDEEIIEAFNGYPLPRTFYSQAISKTSGVAGITVLMPDPDIRGKEHDALLASALLNSPAVLAFVASTQANEGGPHVGTAQIGGDPHLWLYRYPGILRQEHLSAGVGLINTSPEIDGVVRRIPLAVGSQGKIYPSFALEMLRVGVGDPSYQIKTTEGGIEWLRVPNYPPMYTDSNARVWLNYNVKFHKQTAAEFMRNPIAAPFIIFGVTGEGIVNPLPTPAGLKYPHEIQANLLHNLIEGTSPSTPEWGQLAEIVTAVGLISLLLITSYSIILSLPTLILSIVGLSYTTWNLFQSSYLFDVSSIIIICFLYWSIVTFRNFVQQFILRRRISQQFGTYAEIGWGNKTHDISFF
jgi:adenylate cyclase